MKYEFQVSGMHCQGCVNLIKLSWADFDSSEMQLDLTTGRGEITTDLDSNSLKIKLDQTFADLAGYSWENLVKIN